MKKNTILILVCIIMFSQLVSAEVMLQWFGTTWNEMTEKMPILAELGYGSIYTPVPNKAGSQWSVGYDLQDRFDLGDEDQNGTIATKYGTKHELIRMVETAHRFGIRVYFDNVMNHNSFGTPGYDVNTPVDLYPDMLPEDFHVVQNGYFYRKSGEIQGHHYDNGDHEAIQHYTLSDLCDISNESGNWDFPGEPDLSFVRQPNEPDKYPDTDLTPISSGGIDVYPFNESDPDQGDPSSEDVNAYLIRSVRWLMNETKCDGIRFDAAKHVVPYFFGSYSVDDFAGYCGAIQAEYNLTHGHNDTDNRDALFDEDRPRDDAILFGECVPHTNLEPFDYISRGMRLLDFYWEGTMSTALNGWGNENYCGSILNRDPLGASYGIMQMQNHDHPQHADMDLMYAYSILSDGIPLVYTDGNNHAAPDKWGRVFPEYGRGDFLGQYQNSAISDRLPFLIWTPGPESELTRSIWIHEQFSRGYDNNKWEDADVVINQKIYPNNYQGTAYNDNEGAILLFGVNNDDFSQEHHNVDPFVHFRPGTLLHNYGTVHDGMTAYQWSRVGDNVDSEWKLNISIPPGHYVAYSYMVPGRSQPEWAGGAIVDPILLEQPAGTPLSTIDTYRTDSLQGDDDWDDDGIPNENDPIPIARLTGNDDMRIVSLTDGLAVSAMVKIDDGIDVDGNGLDNPPGQATDVFLGYEPMSCKHKRHGSTYFYDRDNTNGAPDQWYAITSDMDTDTDNEADFWVRHEYEFEYDASVNVTNLEEGYHIVRTRLFRKRLGGPNDGCDIFNTFKKVFYVDRSAPTGVFGYPRSGETLWSKEYGMAFRTDDTVTEVLVHIDDNDPDNDDFVTGIENGNGISTSGVGQAWAVATSSDPNPSDSELLQYNDTYPREWRHAYRNIPSTGSATISVQLREDSSSIDTNRITTLTSVHDCRSPNRELFIAWPQHGSTFSFTSYGIVIKFSDSLSYNATNFSILIDNAFQSRDHYVFDDYDWGDNYGELRYSWSNFSSGTHTIITRYEDNEFSLEASAVVTTTEGISYVKFLDPPALDNNGLNYTMILDYPEPPATSVEYQIAINTSDDIESLTIDIDDGTWSGSLTPQSTNEGAISWTYDWTGISPVNEGSHSLEAVGVVGGVSITSSVSPVIVFKQTVDNDLSDTDDDDDGIPDGTNWLVNPGETVGYDINSHKPNPSDWENGDIHKVFFTGRTDSLSPDTDNDGLSDGLELGLGGSFDAGTDTNTDTDSDGYPNFRPDTDPPIYNTWYHQLAGYEDYYIIEGNQYEMIFGSVTDPNNSDTDYDGLEDGIEDLNKNGAVDSGECDPNDSDTDDDNRQDGSEDSDHDGVIDGDTNNDRQYTSDESWTETDPLNSDSDGDGLPDGWETAFGLDPLDNGYESLRTSSLNDGTLVNGANGDPDNDGYNNMNEYINNTNPQYDESQAGLNPARKIIIGAGDQLGSLGGKDYYELFADWTADDCHVYDGRDDTAGLAEDTGDEYANHKADGYSISRDIIAFYSRDGGSHGEYYFRIDLQDLQYQAEEGYVDLYIVIDTGNPDIGGTWFPEDLDCQSEMQWEVIIACYETGIGSVYVRDPGNGNVSADNGYFLGSNFRSDLDSVEIAINRQALMDAGWSGFSALNYQVFTTKDGTCNDCESGQPGEGDVSGTSDIADAIMDSTRGWGGTLTGWIPSTWKVNPVKLAILLQGNQPNIAGNKVQEYLYDNTVSPPTGYFRALDAHKLFDVALNLQIAGSLASSLEWAVSDSDSNKDGSVFNDEIASMIRSNQADLIVGPYVDMLIPHFPGQATEDAYDAGRKVLDTIYGTDFTDENWWEIHWLPERAVDGNTLSSFTNHNIYFTIIDQWTHLYNWFGRSAAISAAGYKVQEINQVKCFAISKMASDDVFESYDGGLTLTLRNLLHEKGQEGWTDWHKTQVVVMFAKWEDMTTPNESSSGQAGANASTYDNNLFWIANHPWIETVLMPDITKGELPVGGETYWSTVNHGTDLELSRQANEYVHFASVGDYDHWYYGSSGAEESLYDWNPTYENGLAIAKDFGNISTPNTIQKETWDLVSNSGYSDIANLGRLHFIAGMFETGFHEEDSTNMDRWSHGGYKYPDDSYDELADWTKTAQAHAREASIYNNVASWATSPTGIMRQEADIDNDGENEMILCNNRVYAVFEDNGGRMIKAFVRDPSTARAFQVLGNSGAYPDGEKEDEGTDHTAARTSALKDWSAGSEGSKYVNDIYSASTIANGWSFTSTDTKIQKSISLASADSTTFDIQYVVDAGISTLWIRNGLSPNLYDLMHYGQSHLGSLQNDGSVLSLENNDFSNTVGVKLHYQGGGNNVTYNSLAVDHNGGYSTRNMRNQAFVEQVEVGGVGAFEFQIEFYANRTDTDSDGTPNDLDSDDDNDGYSDTVELTIDPLTKLPQSDPWDASSIPPDFDSDGIVDADDPDDDNDGMSDSDETIAQTNPHDSNSLLRVSSASMDSSDISLEWTTVGGLRYTIYYVNREEGYADNMTWLDLSESVFEVWEEDVIAGEEDVESFIDTHVHTGASTQRFYRIKVHSD